MTYGWLLSSIPGNRLANDRGRAALVPGRMTADMLPRVSPPSAANDGPSSIAPAWWALAIVLVVSVL